MNEILPGVHHWTTYHEGIGQPVHSAYVDATEPSLVVDPRVPDGGITAFEEDPPAHILLTNRLHRRHSDDFARAFDATIWLHRAGLHAFADLSPPDRDAIRSDAPVEVEAFEHGDPLPAGVRALEVGSLCPEETALHLPVGDGILALGDAVIRRDEELAFVPDHLMGDDPSGVKRGIVRALLAILEDDEIGFDHLLLAHGPPLVGEAPAVLGRFVDSFAD